MTTCATHHYNHCHYLGGLMVKHSRQAMVRPLAELVHTTLASAIICFMYTPSLSACEDPSSQKAFPTAGSCVRECSVCGVLAGTLCKPEST